MSAVLDLNAVIVRTPEICGGRPRISGTRITVERIAVWDKMGMSAETIAHEIPHLNMVQIYTALAYYHANQEEIDAGIAAEEAEYNLYTLALK
jgi:uncharacterized protein (DUF433 family)